VCEGRSEFWRCEVVVFEIGGSQPRKVLQHFAKGMLTFDTFVSNPGLILFALCDLRMFVTGMCLGVNGPSTVFMEILAGWSVWMRL